LPTTNQEVGRPADTAQIFLATPKRQHIDDVGDKGVVTIVLIGTVGQFWIISIVIAVVSVGVGIGGPWTNPAGHRPAASRHPVAPRLFRLQHNLGNANATLHQFPQAISHFRKAVQLNPEDSMAEANLGAALAEIGELASAKTHWERAL
jgi:tetratricopeptide (TPR) repeat protein